MRYLISVTVMELTDFIRWAKEEKVFFWHEAVAAFGWGKANILLSLLTSAQLLFRIRFDSSWRCQRLYYTIYLYNEAAEEYWNSDRGE